MAIIVFSNGENACNQTGTVTGTTFSIPVAGQSVACIPASGAAIEHDDIVQYADIDKLRAQTCSSFRITTESLPSGTEEFIYPAVTFEGTDGTPPYTWTLAGGARPDRRATKTLSLAINAGTGLSCSLSANPGSRGAAYNTTLLSGGGLSPFAWSWTGNPSTLALNAAAGQTTGTPAAADVGTRTVTVTLRDSCSTVQTATRAYTLNIGYNANYVARNQRTSAPVPYYVLGGQYTTCTTRTANQDFNVRSVDTTPVRVYSQAGCINEQRSITYADSIAADADRDGLLGINNTYSLIDR